MARSAINSVIKLLNHKYLDTHLLIRWFIRGVHDFRLPFMKQSKVWDPRILLRYIDDIGDNDDLTLKQLTYKTVALLKLLSGSRVHCVHAFSTDCMHKSGGMHSLFMPLCCSSIPVLSFAGNLSHIGRTQRTPDCV